MRRETDLPMPTATATRPTRLRGGLRIKTAAALLFLAIVTLLLALVVGRWAVDNIRGYFGEAFARNHALLTRQRILTVIGRDLALSQRLAESPLVHEWLLDEDDPEKRARVAREMASYRAGFADDNYFLISALSYNYYFGDDHSDGQPTLRYTLNPDDPDDAWFFATVNTVDDYGINVNPDEKLQVTNIWFNVVVHDADGTPIGLAGTGFELSRFLQEFIASAEPGVVTLMIDRDGAIMAHPDPEMIEYSSISRDRSEKTLFQLLDDAQSRQAVERLMDTGTGDVPEARSTLVELDGREQLVALSPIPELDWFVVASVDLDARRMLDQELIIGAALGGGGLILLLLLLTTLGVDRLILLPLARLTDSVREIASGRYDVRLYSDRRDELGELHRAVDTMARQIRHHTENLEQRVAERTEALAAANARIAEAHDKLTDSIRYASLIQHIILPDQKLEQQFPGEQFVLWLPRDVVGGDFYLYRNHPRHGHLLGVVDCAGHGVPGAFMTMIAHAALDTALSETDWHDPAALLTRTDQVLRGMLPTRQRFGQIATNMDLGLCHLDPACRQLTFSGARLALFWSDGADCHEIAGQRRGLNDRRIGDYENTRVDVVPGRTFYLVSDGLFDQAGGAQGYGYGAARFKDQVRTMAAQPLSIQRAALHEHLTAYQGDHPQRDDITVLAFRCDTHDNRLGPSGPRE